MQYSRSIYGILLILLVALWSASCQRDQEVSQEEKGGRLAAESRAAGEPSHIACPPLPPPSTEALEKMVTISLSRNDDGATRVNDKAPLYGESFVFDEEKGNAAVAAGAELNIVGGYPVPIRITSMGHNFSGSFSPVYENVLFECDRIPSESRLFYLASVDVHKGFSYDARIKADQSDSFFISSEHHVFRDREPSPQADAPFIEIVFTATQANGNNTDDSPLADVAVEIERDGQQSVTATTDAAGIARISLDCVHEDLLGFRATHPEGNPVLEYPLPISLRAASAGLVVYEITINFDQASGDQEGLPR